MEKDPDCSPKRIARIRSAYEDFKKEEWIIKAITGSCRKKPLKVPCFQHFSVDKDPDLL